MNNKFAAMRVTTAMRLGIYWLIAFCLCLAGCGGATAPPPDAIPPEVFAQPAGGVFPALPERVGLESTKNATIYYTLDGSPPTLTSQVYRTPIRLGGGDVTLRFFAQDPAGNRSRMQVERYRRVVGAPQITLSATRPLRLGPQQSASVCWVCSQHCGRFQLTTGNGGWGHPLALDTGTVQAGQEVCSHLTAARLPGTHTRLWVSVKSPAGVLGAVSLPLTIDRHPPQAYAWPAGGTYSTLPSVALVTHEAATVYYTSDGSSPTPNSPIYTAPLRLHGETTLRFLAIDRFGNQGAMQTESYRVLKQAPSVRLQQFPGVRLETRATLRFTWQSSRRGRYLLSVNDQPLLRGRVARHKPVQSVVHGWSLHAPRNRLRLRVTDDTGREGSTSFVVDTFFRETFARHTALAGEVTTAHWDAATQRMLLPTGPLLVGVHETSHTSRGVASQGAYAYVANTRGGLRVLDLTAADQPQPVGSLFMYGEPKALAKYQQYVYLVADTSDVQIFDVSQPQAPLLVGQQPLPGRASAITIVGTRAYIGTQQHGLYLYDLTQPRHPRLLAHVPLDMPVVHLAATATHVYVAGFDAGVAIIDVTTPTTPRLLTTLPPSLTGEAVLGVAVHDQRLYVAAGTLTVFDIQDAAQPQRMALLPLSSAHGVAMHNDRVYVAEQYHGLRIVDAAALPPRILGTYDTPNRAVRVVLQGQLALIADVLGGIHLINVSQPEHPELLQSLPNLGQIVDVWIEDGFAYLANRQGQTRLLVADVREPQQARIVGTYSNGALTDVVLSGPLAYILDAFGGLQVLDISQPQQPRVLGAQRTPGVAQGLTLYGAYALVTAGHAGLQIIDVSQPAQPTPVASLPLPGESVDVVTWGTYAYVAAGTGGMAVVDLARPEAPHLFGTVRPPQHGNGEKVVRLAVEGPYLYASTTAPGLLVFSLASPQQPRLLQQVANPQGTLWALVPHGRYLYATTILNHLTVFDISDPTQLRELGTATSGARDLALALPYLLLATEAYKRRGGGLRVLDVYTPLPPRAGPQWPIDAFDVVATGPHLYMAAGQAGLIIGQRTATGQVERRAHLSWHDTAQRLIVCGPRAYVGGQHTLAVVDISVTSTPRLLSTLDLGTPVADLECSGSLLLLATAARGLLLVDVSDPTRPLLQATVPVAGGLQHLAGWGGGYVLGAGAGGEVIVFDLTTPSQPRIRQRLDLALPIRDLALYGHHAYLATGASGLRVIRLQSTGALRPLPHSVWEGEVQALACWGRWLYVVDTQQGLVGLDLSNPEVPRRFAATPLVFLPAASPRLFTADTAIYLAWGAPGLQSFTMATSRTTVRVPQATVQSLRVDTATQPLVSATLWALAWSDVHSRITYDLSHDGGHTWVQVVPGRPYRFSTPGHDLRWRAVLHGLTPLADPALYELQLTYELTPSLP